MYKDLIEKAIEARKLAYTPYSGFSVGASLLAEDGKIFTGCNIENVSYSATVCAERTAIFKAVSEGERCFTAIAVVGGKAGKEPENYCSPCGICRQVITEFEKDENFVIIIAKTPDDYKTYTIKELLPISFKKED